MIGMKKDSRLNILLQDLGMKAAFTRPKGFGFIRFSRIHQLCFRGSMLAKQVFFLKKKIEIFAGLFAIKWIIFLSVNLRMTEYARLVLENEWKFLRTPSASLVMRPVTLGWGRNKSYFKVMLVQNSYFEGRVNNLPPAFLILHLQCMFQGYYLFNIA